MIEAPYLSKEIIEGKANQLLQAARIAGRIKYKPPIDVESIIENHLKLGLEIVNFGDLSIFGGLDVKNRIIKVNAAFDPFDNRKFQGLYHFTLAHEVGHEVLHAPLLDKDSNAILCRSSHAFMSIEWQADFFAASLLMPRDLVLNAFGAMFGSVQPYRSDSILLKASLDPRFKKIVMAKRGNFSPMAIMDVTFEKLAVAFSVSPRAMVIRLKELGLLILEGKLMEECEHNFVLSV